MGIHRFHVCQTNKLVNIGVITHIAFDISPNDFKAFSSRVLSSGVEVWKQNKSEGQSLYILDPDGHKLEVHVGSLGSRLEALHSKPYSGLVWL